MTQDDVLFGYRLQLFDLAARTAVAHACRTLGVHRSTYYRWKARSTARAWRCSVPRERRRPLMPNQLPPMVEERIVAFSLGHPGLGPRRIAAQLARPEWGAFRSRPTASGRCCVRHGLDTRAKRLALIAGYRAPYEPPREPPPEPHVEVARPGELVGIDCFFVGRLHGTHGRGLADHRDRHLLLVRLGRAGRLPRGPADRPQTSTLARRVARELAGGRLAP